MRVLLYVGKDREDEQRETEEQQRLGLCVEEARLKVSVISWMRPQGTDVIVPVECFRTKMMCLFSTC